MSSLELLIPKAIGKLLLPPVVNALLGFAGLLLCRYRTGGHRHPRL